MKNELGSELKASSQSCERQRLARNGPAASPKPVGEEPAEHEDLGSYLDLGDGRSAGKTPGLAPLKDRVLTLVAIVLPFLGLVAGAVSVWGWGFGWIDLGLLTGFYILTMLAITVGYHRLFTHGAFETNDTVKFILAAVGSMAVQGSLLHWVAVHRRHHQLSDSPDDPHSPVHHGPGTGGLLGGVWHSHIGWFFEADPVNISRYVQDLSKNAALQVASALFPLWVTLSLLIPAMLGGLLTGTWRGALAGLIWGGLVRIFLVHHLTWSVNSACHLWGRCPFQSNDHSRDNFFFGVFAMGDGWHNTHHAFPNSARHGLRWWQMDASYAVIRLLETLGLAWNVKLPSEQARALKRTQAL